MKCDHCRAKFDSKEDMTIETFYRFLDFCNFNNNFDFTISGGEPFLHKNFFDFLYILKAKNVNEVVVTTNGSFINQSIIDSLKKVNLNKLTIQVSIDHIFPESHDSFRHFHGAYDLATSAIRLLNKNHVFVSMRVSLTKYTLLYLEQFVELAIDLGAKRIGLTCVVPSGNALVRTDFIVSPLDKYNMFQSLKKLKEKYRSIEIVTGDPIKFLAGFSETTTIPEADENFIFYGGCEAGISRINCDSVGNITPCALLPVKILNLNENSNKEDQQNYVKNKKIIDLS